MTDSLEISFEVLANDSPVPSAQRERVMAEPGFGQVFTDHMTTIRWTEDRGWHDARLEPYGQIVLDPASAVLHYGQEIFEGLKAYAQPDGRVVSFRPQANAARLGIMYVIYRQHIWDVRMPSSGWRPMEDRGSITANHFDHVHISVF